MKNLKSKIFSLFIVALLTIPSILVFSPKKALATVIANCNGNPNLVCYSNAKGDIIYGKGKVIIDN